MRIALAAPATSRSQTADAPDRLPERKRCGDRITEAQQRQVVLFRDVIIPQARQTVDASLSGYRAGKLDFLTLVDNWRRLFEFEVIYHQDLAALKQSLADLQQAVGRNLDLAPTADAGAAVQELQP